MLIHCSMEELIAIRDGQGNTAAREHLESCDDCMMEMERLHQRVASLRALRTPSPPRDRWPQVRDRVVAARRRDRVGFAARYGLVAAAVVAVVLTGVNVITPGMTQRPERTPEVVTLMEHSQNLEGALREIKPGSRVMNGRLAATVVTLEEGIADVDEALSELRRREEVPPSRFENLWRQRVMLMDELVRVHATRATYVGF